MVVLISALAGSCGGGPPPETFDLSAPRSGIRAGAPSRQIVVAEPVATAPTDSDRIVVRMSEEAVATLSGAQWVDRLPRLVQTRLIQTFENGHLLRSVGRPGERITADYALASEIRRFEIDIARNLAVVEISVKLVGDLNGRIAAAQIFSAQAPVTSNQGAAAASAALDQALGQVMTKIVAWAASRA